MPHTWDPDSLTPEEALGRLADGNRRFREGTGTAGRCWTSGMATESQRPEHTHEVVATPDKQAMWSRSENV